MPYSERLRCYEAEKRQLCAANMNAKEYERAIRKLADKWRV